MDVGQQIYDAGLAGVMPGTTIAADPYSSHPTAGDTGIATGVGAGQHGLVPLLQNGGTVTDAVQAVWGWLNRPFTQPMSAMGVFTLVGAVLIAVIVWNLILYHIRIAAEAI